MTEIEIGDTHWYGVSYLFETPELARAAFHSVFNSDPSGALGVGVYRHQRVGLDTGPVIVSVVGLHRRGAERAESMLISSKGGREIAQHPETWKALIKRRIEAVVALEASGKSEGRYKVVHPPEGREL